MGHGPEADADRLLTCLLTVGAAASFALGAKGRVAGTQATEGGAHGVAMLALSWEAWLGSNAIDKGSP